MTAPRVVIIGVGNPYRRDDGVGRAAARLIAARGFLGQVLESDGGLELLDAWQGAGVAVVIDAVAAGAAPGTIDVLRAEDGPLPAALGAGSSHALGVAQAVELGRALGRLPPRLSIYGVEGEDFAPGEGLTPAVERAAAEVAEQVLAALSTFLHEEVPVHERSLMMDLMRKIDGLAREHGAERVSKISVRLGALSHFTPEHFREHFDLAAAGTAAAGAALDIEIGADPGEPNAQGVVLRGVDLEVPE